MYIPKSQIKDNLFTPGGEWFYVSNNSPYTGFYYQLANGKAYTGKDQNTPPNEEIYQNISKFSTLTFAKFCWSSDWIKFSKASKFPSFICSKTYCLMLEPNAGLKTLEPFGVRKKLTKFDFS